MTDRDSFISMVLSVATGAAHRRARASQVRRAGTGEFETALAASSDKPQPNRDHEERAKSYQRASAPSLGCHTDPLQGRRTTWLSTDVPTLSPMAMHVRQTVQCSIRSASARRTLANLSLGCLMVIRR